MLPTLLVLTAGASAALAKTTTLVKVGVNSTGQAAFAYTPPFIDGAAPGDDIIFEFHPKNHTVTQSNFTSPCVFNHGFDSGFQPVSSDSELKTIKFTIPETAASPLWFYCRQVNPATNLTHCQEGMVFGVNIKSDNISDAAFQDKFTTFQEDAEGLSNTTASTTITPVVVTATLTETTTISGVATQSVWTSTWASWPGSPEPTLGSSTYDVQVGPNGTLTYDPPLLIASPGDKVVFHFNPKNHSVTQGLDFYDPCTPSPSGFDSGFMPVNASGIPAQQPNFTISINTTGPVYVYCRQTGHCEKGMVMAINMPIGYTMEQFLVNANISANSSAGGSSPSSTGKPNNAMSVRGSGSAVVGLILAAIISLLL